MTRATVCFESSWIWLQISVIRAHNQRPFDSGSDEEGQRDICVPSWTWFRNMLEPIGAAFAITQPYGNITGIKGCERAETVMGQYAGSTVARISRADGATRALCAKPGVYCARQLSLVSPTSSSPTIIFTLRCWAQLPDPMGCQAVPPPFWCQGTWLHSKLVLGEAAGQQPDEMFSTRTGLLSAAVTEELPLLALLPLCLPARGTLLPQHSSLMNAKGGMWMEVSSPHTFLQKYTAVLMERYHPSSSGAQKREGLQWAHSRQTAAILHPYRCVRKYSQTHRNIKWTCADWGSGPYILWYNYCRKKISNNQYKRKGGISCLLQSARSCCSLWARRMGWIQCCNTARFTFRYFPTVPQLKFMQIHTQLKLRPRLQVIKKCSNLYLLYFSVIYLECFITCTIYLQLYIVSPAIDNTAVLTHEWIAQEIHFIYIFALPPLRRSLFAQPSHCSAPWTPLLGAQHSFALWMLLPALFRALHMPRAALSSCCYHWELAAWYNRIKYTHRIFLQWKHKTIFYWVLQP